MVEKICLYQNANGTSGCSTNNSKSLRGHKPLVILGTKQSITIQATKLLPMLVINFRYTLTSQGYSYYSIHKDAT